MLLLLEMWYASSTVSLASYLIFMQCLNECMYPFYQTVLQDNTVIMLTMLTLLSTS